MTRKTDTQAAPQDPRVADAVRRIWGYDTLRPLQAEAIDAGLSRQDALVVMPTGGGKSLCYQVPPLVADRIDIVVSPLIALMKDQVDGLRQLGYPAAALHSNLSAAERNEIQCGIRERKYRLLYVAPERLVGSWFLQTVEHLNIHAFAIDEAHCISEWGHDFRPEYRQLAILRQRFPDASIHAYTATATPRVREDIVTQLKLRDPLVLVGKFDRPNLTYRILPQIDRDQQVVEVLQRHEGEAAIVYCLSRRETESLAGTLRSFGIKAEHYHAGMPAEQRRICQDRFASEEIDVVVATIAFGMGIDRSNVRAVIHACLPKTIENYQQETGRAGRDGLPAECVLLYSQADVMRLERIIKKNVDDAADREKAAANVPVQLELLHRMRVLAHGADCRHRALSEYFGQAYTNGNCQACDVCLGEVEGVEDSTVTAQKILSCVARVNQRFGVGHVVEVLVGANTERITQLGHDQLSTHGLLSDLPRKTVQGYIYQLLDQDQLTRSEGDRPVLQLNKASWEIMRGERKVRLVQPKRDLETGRSRRSRARSHDGEDGFGVDPWEGADEGLFEHLRQVRRQIASRQGVPPYVILHDRALLDLARVRPTSHELLKRIRGIGEHKRITYGDRLIEAISTYCRDNNLQPSATAAGLAPPPRANPVKQLAQRLFAAGQPIEAVMEQTMRARSTIVTYLVEWVAETGPESISPWVGPDLYQRIAAGVEPGDATLKAIFERFGGDVPYDMIRLVVTHLSTQQTSGPKH